MMKQQRNVPQEETLTLPPLVIIEHIFSHFIFWLSTITVPCMIF